MGMGKSLSILALVIKTLDGANTWRLGEDSSLNELVEEGGQTLTPSRATLVLVPSARMFATWQYLNRILESMADYSSSAPTRMADRDQEVGTRPSPRKFDSAR
jgi:hypothetical protein